jgi:hypothetical protein
LGGPGASTSTPKTPPPPKGGRQACQRHTCSRPPAAASGFAGAGGGHAWLTGNLADPKHHRRAAGSAPPPNFTVPRLPPATAPPSPPDNQAALSDCGLPSQSSCTKDTKFTIYGSDDEEVKSAQGDKEFRWVVIQPIQPAPMLGPKRRALAQGTTYQLRPADRAAVTCAFDTAYQLTCPGYLADDKKQTFRVNNGVWEVYATGSTTPNFTVCSASGMITLQSGPVVNCGNFKFAPEGTYSMNELGVCAVPSRRCECHSKHTLAT